MFPIVQCLPTDASALTKIALQSKSHWGYDDEFMLASTAELRVNQQDMNNPQKQYKKAVDEHGAKMLGYYCLAKLNSTNEPTNSQLKPMDNTFSVANLATALMRLKSRLNLDPSSQVSLPFDQIQTLLGVSWLELDALFVKPDCMGLGIGKRLFRDACKYAQQSNKACILIHSDPNAVDFYLRQGCQRIGDAPSGSIVNRSLPLLIFPAIINHVN